LVTVCESRGIQNHVNLTIEIKTQAAAYPCRDERRHFTELYAQTH
jgi:hypothetical protein